MRLQGKVALVTGSASGIGYAISELFAKEGATLFAGDMCGPQAPYNPSIQAIDLQVENERVWESAVDTIVERSGRLDILVNVAELSPCEPAHNLELAVWSKIIAVNQTGVFLGMREAIRVMRRQQFGAIVNVSSIFGSVALHGGHSYQAASGAVSSMSRNAAVTYAADGIRINSILAVFVQTAAPGTRALSISTTSNAATPMHRAASAIEVAYGCLYLASDEARFVTGAELPINGGYIAQ